MTVRVRLEPVGVTIECTRGMRLAEMLAPYGVEFPCGGAGTCGGCEVRTAEGQRVQACGLRAGCDTTLHVDQWQPQILTDETLVTATSRESGYGVAIDIGTTTVVAQLVDLASGEVLNVLSSLNPQAAFGADLMSRIGLARHSDRPMQLLRSHLDSLTSAVCKGLPVTRIVLVGNTAMHHIWADLPVHALTEAPYRTPFLTEQRNGISRFLRCLGGFVGSDVLAGVVATNLTGHRGTAALIDLGTNGEIVVFARGRLWCASTAAGPAFEGAGINQGMRASTGAISHVASNGACSVLGGVEARGICGSGLVDAVAYGLNTGAIHPSGRMKQPLRLTSNVQLEQADVRQLQLAKAAVAAGLQIVLQQAGAAPNDIEVLYIAGAFGNYLHPDSALRIRLFAGVPPLRWKPAGNAALRGARTLLLHPDREPEFPVEHVELAAQPQFQNIFAEQMTFPTTGATT